MLMNLMNSLPDMPHLTTLSQVSFCVLGGSFVMYMLSKMPELLLISTISLIYGLVPLLK
jgi:hypothetical protein